MTSLGLDLALADWLPVGVEDLPDPFAGVTGDLHDLHLTHPVSGGLDDGFGELGAEFVGPLGGASVCGGYRSQVAGHGPIVAQARWPIQLASRRPLMYGNRVGQSSCREESR